MDTGLVNHIGFPGRDPGQRNMKNEPNRLKAARWISRAENLAESTRRDQRGQ